MYITATELWPLRLDSTEPGMETANLVCTVQPVEREVVVLDRRPNKLEPEGAMASFMLPTGAASVVQLLAHLEEMVAPFN